jgi:hypothetical protein
LLLRMVSIVNHGPAKVRCRTPPPDGTAAAAPEREPAAEYEKSKDKSARKKS